MRTPTEIVTDLYAAFGRGDLPTLLAGLSDDVEWTFDGLASDAYSRTARGRDDVARWFAEVLAVDGIEAFEPRQMLAGADHVTVLGWERCRALPAGGVFESPWLHVWRLRGEQVCGFRGMLDTAAVARARDSGGHVR